MYCAHERVFESVTGPHAGMDIGLEILLLCPWSHTAMV